MWLHSLKVAQLLRSAACLHTNQSRSYLNHLVHKSSRTGSVKDEVLRRVKEERNVPHTIKSRKANWICHALRINCLLKHVIKGKIKLT